MIEIVLTNDTVISPDNVTVPDVAKNSSSRTLVIDETKMLRWVTETFFLWPLIIIGLIGNAVVFMALCTRSCRDRQHQWHTQRAIATLLQSLAVADSAVLFTFLLRLQFITELRPLKPLLAWSFRWTYTATYWCRTGNTWLTVLLTVNRYAVVCRPIVAHQLCTVRRTYMLILFVAVGSLLTSCPRFFEYVYIERANMSWNVATSFRSHEVYLVGYRLIASSLLIYLVPMTVLFGLNIRILVALWHSTGHLSQQQPQQQRDTRETGCTERRHLPAKECRHGRGCDCSTCLTRRHRDAWHGDQRRRRHGDVDGRQEQLQDEVMDGAGNDGRDVAVVDVMADGGNDARLQQRRDAAHSNTSGLRSVYGNVTIIVVTIVSVCVLCNLSAMLSHIIWWLEDVDTGRHKSTVKRWRRQISNVSNILVTLNSSVNFFIYCICSRDFRLVLYRMFCCGLCRHRCQKLQPIQAAPNLMRAPVIWHNSRQKQRFGTAAAAAAPCYRAAASRRHTLRPVILQQANYGRGNRQLASLRQQHGDVVQAAAVNAAISNTATAAPGVFWPSNPRYAGAPRSPVEDGPCNEINYGTDAARSDRNARRISGHRLNVYGCNGVILGVQPCDM